MQLPDPAPAARPAACSACGDLLDPDDRFCGRCGRATAPPGSGGPGRPAPAPGAAAPDTAAPDSAGPRRPYAPDAPGVPGADGPFAPGGSTRPGGGRAPSAGSPVPASPLPPLPADRRRQPEHGPAGAGDSTPRPNDRAQAAAGTRAAAPASDRVPAPPGPHPVARSHANGDRPEEHSASGRGGEEAAGHPAEDTGSFRLAPPRRPGTPGAAGTPDAERGPAAGPGAGPCPAEAAPGAGRGPAQDPGGQDDGRDAVAAPDPGGEPPADADAGAECEPREHTGPQTGGDPAPGTGAAPGGEPAAGTETAHSGEPHTSADPGADGDPAAGAGPEPAGVPGPGGGLGGAARERVCVACGLGGVDHDGYCEHCGHAQPRRRDHQEQELEGVAAVSDRGLRHHRNEDAFTVATASLPDGSPAVAAVVCDGVSSAYRPDDASAAACAAGGEALLTALERGTGAQEAMRGTLLAAFDAVAALAEEDVPAGAAHRNAPACTCVSAVVTGEVFTVGWIGDSRAYWIPDDRSRPPSRLTEDDSWAARMVAAGLMSQAEAYADERAHAITGWLGADAVEVDPHVAAFQPDGPGVIVVCTDGLWNYAESAAEMAAAVPADARARPLHSARTLLGVALDGGGHDNVTVAVLPFPAAVSRAGSPSVPVSRRP